MPANNTNQSMLRGVQGGSPTSQAQNQRAQMYTRNTAPTTAYNTSTSGGSMYGMNPRGGQYGNQQANLGRYTPPTMQNPGGGFGNPDMWRQGGGYAYNIPNAYGQTGIGYMGGFDQSMLQQAYNPFMQGGYGPPASGMGGVDAQRAGQQGGNSGQFNNMFNGMGGGGGMANNGFMQMLQQYFQGQQGGPAYGMTGGGQQPNRGGGFGAEPAGPPANSRGGQSDPFNGHPAWSGPAPYTGPEFTAGGYTYGGQQGTNAPARSNAANNPLPSYGMTGGGNSFSGMARGAPSPVDTWSGGGVQPMPNRMWGGSIGQPAQRSQPQGPQTTSQPFVNPFMGLPGGFGGGG